jgi:hypothetical protein
MIRALLILLIGLAAAVAGFKGIQWQSETAHRGAVSSDTKSKLPELQWLREELKLNDEQFAAVTAAHEAYRPTCEALCMRVMASHAKIKQLADVKRPVSPELEEALKEHALLHVECQKAMLNHLHKTAALMRPDQAQHYLDALLPQVIELPMEPHHMGENH